MAYGNQLFGSAAVPAAPVRHVTGAAVPAALPGEATP
jgi:hypothetical protein